MDTEYKKQAAKLEAMRRARFYYEDKEDVPSRYELFIGSDDLMEGELARHMPRDYGDLAGSLEKPTFPLVDCLQGHKAVAFRENVVVELVDPATSMPVPAAELPVGPYLAYLASQSGFLSAMAMADSYLVTHRTVGVRVRLRSDGRARLEALPVYCLDVEPDPYDQDDSALAKRIVVPERGDVYPDEGDRRIVYERKGKDFTATLANSDGMPFVPDPENPVPENEGFKLGLVPGTNRLKVPSHPVLILKEHDSSTWNCPLPKALSKGQVSINRLLVELQLAFRAGAHGQLYLYQQPNTLDPFVGAGGAQREIGEVASESAALKVKSTPVNVATGVTALPVIPSGYNMGLVQARVDAVALMKYVEAHIKLVYGAERMVISQIDLFNPQPSNISGRAKLVDAQPQEGEKQRREQRLSELAVKVLDLWRRYHNLTAPANLRIPENLQWRVRFRSLVNPGLFADQSAAQGIEVMSKLGLADLGEVAALLHGVSVEEGRRRVMVNTGFYGKTQQFAKRELD